MNHGFTPSQMDQAKCRCGRNELDHTARATCDDCGNSGNCENLQIPLTRETEKGIFSHTITNMLLCPECYEKNKPIQVEIKSSSAATLEISRKVDNSIQLREDIYNAEMVAIADLRRAFESDPSVTEKHFALSKAISEKYAKLSEVIEQNNTSTQVALNKQRALQTTWQELAKSLSEQQREQIKLKDVNYKPVAPKLEKKKAPSLLKYNATAVREASVKSGIPANVIQGVCARRNVTPMEAVHICKEAGM